MFQKIDFNTKVRFKPTGSGETIVAVRDPTYHEAWKRRGGRDEGFMETPLWCFLSWFGPFSPHPNGTRPWTELEVEAGEGEVRAERNEAVTELHEALNKLNEASRDALEKARQLA